MSTDVSAKYNSFPSDFESLEQKKTDRYGLEYVKAMYALHIINNPINNPQQLKYLENREFALGTYSTDIYKGRLGLTGDTSFLNLDLSSINRIPSILENMVGKMVNKKWNFQCNPLDTVSRNKFDEQKAELKADRFLKQKSAEAEALTGTPLVGKDKKVFEDDEELELHMQMNFKLEEAMAMEEALKWVFDNNHFEKESLPQLYRDIFTDNKTAIFRYYDANKNIRVERWDHLKIIQAYSQFEDFRDSSYQGLVPTYTIGDIAKLNPKFTDEDLYNIAKNNAGINSNSSWDTNWFDNYARYSETYGGIACRQFQSFNINVVNFYFLSPIHDTKAIKTSESGRVRIEDKKDGYVADKKEKTYGEKTESIEISKKRKVVRFEGFWIPNTDYIWNYKRSENEERDIVAGAYSPETELPCKIIMPNQLGMRNKSKVAKMIPFEKQLCIAWYKLQQFLIEAAPPGIMVNQNALLEIVEGVGEGKALPTDWTKLYKQTGNIVFTDTDASGRIINGKPIEELQGGISSKFQELLVVMDYTIGKMNEVVGYNTAVDASSPKADALVGINQMAQAATYDVLRPDYIYITNLIEKSAKRVSLMIQDSLRLGNESFRVALAKAIGEKNVEVLTNGREHPFSSAAISIEMQPDDQEVAELNILIQLGIQSGTLTPSDVLRVRQQMKTNIKLAGQLMVYLENKNAKRKQKEALEQSQQNGQVQMQSAQAASQAQAQLDEAVTANKIKVLEAGSSFDIQKMQIEFQNEMRLQELKNQGIEVVAVINSNRAENVQQVINDGKKEVEQIKHESGMIKTAFESAIAPKKEEKKSK